MDEFAFPPFRSCPLALGFLPLHMAGAYVLCTLCSLIYLTCSGGLVLVLELGLVLVLSLDLDLDLVLGLGYGVWV